MRKQTKDLKSNKKNMMWDGCSDPQTKAVENGVESLTDSELIGLILRTGTKEKSAVELAASILKNRNGQLLNLHDLGIRELMNFEGIGEVKAIQLKCISEISKRISKADRKEALRVDDPKSVADYYMERMRHEKQELIYEVLVDAKGNILEEGIVAKGTLMSAVFSPREIFSFAIRGMASCIIILHNHPSGDPTPSKRDDKATKTLIQCGRMLDIPLLDHIVIGDNSYYSYLENRRI